MKYRMLRVIAALMILTLFPGLAEGYWDASHEIRCREHRLNCRLLQTVLMGSFAAFDPEDAVSGRILSAAFPQLCQITDDDIRHFSEEFSEDEAAVRAHRNEALANCLWADIVSDSAPAGHLSAAQRVLLLFLDPAGQPDAQRQMEVIRAAMTDAVRKRISDATGVPEDFILWLMGS